MIRQRRVFLLVACVAVTGIMTAPFVNYAALGSATYEGDVRLIVWTLAWDNHATLLRLPLFDSNIFFPASQSLAYNEHLFGLSLFTLPIYLATGNPVLAYNVLWLLSFPLNLGTAYAFLKRYVADDVAAGAGALVYTFSFYKMLHAHGHLHLVWTWLLPLSLLLFERWVQSPSLLRAALWGGAVLLQSLTSWYLAVMTVIAHVLFVPWSGRKLLQPAVRRCAWQPLLIVAMVALVIWPFAAPYRMLAPAPLREIVSNSADLAGYFIPPENTWTGQFWLRHVGRGPRWIWGEQTIFLGWTASVLALVGGISLVRRRRWAILGAGLTLTIVGGALSLGPSQSGAWTPFSAFALVPFIGAFRAPARLALLVLLGTAILVSSGACALRQRGGWASALAVFCLPLMLAEWFVVGFPGGRPQPFPVPAIYRTAAVQHAKALVSLPEYRGRPDWYTGADYLYFSTAHWRPIVNGFGRAEPPDHAHVVSHMSAFPGPNNARTMRALGVEYVVFHSARVPEGATIVTTAAQTGEYDLVAQFGSDYLFRVRPAPR